MLGNMQTLLMAALDAPETIMHSLPLLPAASRDLVLTGFNKTAQPFPGGLCMHHLFEQQASANPEAPCLASEAGTLSYAEVEAKANQVAHYLISLGGDPSRPVAVLMDRCPELYIAILGVLKSGRAYVPLDPDYPPDRLGFTLQDSAADVLLTHRGFAARVPTHGMHVRISHPSALRSCSTQELLFASTLAVLPHLIVHLLAGVHPCPCCTQRMP